MTAKQQEQFRLYLCERMKHPSPLYFMGFKQLAEEALGREIDHWRTLSQLDARTVMRHVEKRAQAIKQSSETATPDRVAVSVPEVSRHDSTTLPSLFDTP